MHGGAAELQLPFTSPAVSSPSLVNGKVIEGLGSSGHTARYLEVVTTCGDILPQVKHPPDLCRLCDIEQLPNSII